LALLVAQEAQQPSTPISQCQEAAAALLVEPPPCKQVAQEAALSA